MADDARNVAVLIDFENLNETESLTTVLDRAAEHGTIVAKLAVGDFSGNVSKVQSRLIELGILPVQQTTAGKGRNSSDMRLAIEAVDLVHDSRKSINVFVLATSDADFVPLSQWLRAAGKFVVGAGKSDAKSKWRESVDQYVVVKIEEGAKPAEKTLAEKSTTKSVAPKQKTLSKKHRKVIDQVIAEIVAEGSKRISNTEFLKRIREKDPEFSRKTHGFNSFREVVQSIETLRVPPEPKTGDFEIHIRNQKKKSRG